MDAANIGIGGKGMAIRGILKESGTKKLLYKAIHAFIFVVKLEAFLFNFDFRTNNY